jgi:hypothetical protein
MRTTGTSYPPPLSTPPSVETLERMLAALHRPMEPGVPAPPTGSDTSELLFANRPRRVAPPAAPAPRGGLTWSAGGYDPRRLFARSGGVTPVTGALAGAAVTTLLVVLVA